MLAIKLQRIGRKHQPSYRLVVAEQRSKMAAPPVEDLGSYNSFTKAATLKKERALYWIGVGAQPTVTAHNLLVQEGILSVQKRGVKMPKPVAKEAAPVASAETVTVEESGAVAPATEASEAVPEGEASAPVEAASEPVVEAKEESSEK